MIQRPGYLTWLKDAKDQRLIKIVSGVRRCGKSTLFGIFQDYLRSEAGVEDSQIININFEERESAKLLNWEVLYDYIDCRLLHGKKNYVFLDEVQNATDFQRAVDALHLKVNVDLYLTGSNSRFGVGEWATMFRGRYIELKMLPLSFREYVSAYPFNASLDQKFEDYLSNSSFPQTMQFITNGEWNRELIKVYLESLYDGVIVKDVIERKKIREPMKLDSVVRFLFSNIGNETSINNIANKIRADTKGADKELTLHSDTIEKYLGGLIEGYIFYKATRHYIKGKEHLESNAKYYAVDIGLRYSLLGRTNEDRGHILENIVYLELLRRGYKVHVGKVAGKEVDFAAINPKGIAEYYQVAQSLLGGSAEEREIAPLDSIKDHNQKFLLTRDYDNANYNGIQRKNVLKWLLGQD
jgi:predicted AAA+ superfamily ATPase